MKEYEKHQLINKIESLKSDIKLRDYAIKRLTYEFEVLKKLYIIEKNKNL
jgi:hypothetical protein